MTCNFRHRLEIYTSPAWAHARTRARTRWRPTVSPQIAAVSTWRHAWTVSATSVFRNAEITGRRKAGPKFCPANQGDGGKRGSKPRNGSQFRLAALSHADDSYKPSVSESPSTVNPFRYVRSVELCVDDVLTLSLDITGYYDHHLLALERTTRNEPCVLELSPIDKLLDLTDDQTDREFSALWLGRNICSDTGYSAPALRPPPAGKLDGIRTGTLGLELGILLWTWKF